MWDYISQRSVARTAEAHRRVGLDEWGNRVTSASSAGGAGGALGVELQNRVFAWAAAAMVAEEALPKVGVVGRVCSVGAQTGYAVDDVTIRTDMDNFVLVQAKARLRLETAQDGDLAKAVSQAVVQFKEGRLRESTRHERRFDPTRDAIAFCTDPRAPATTREHLAVAVSRVASHPAGTPLDHELTAPQKTAINTLLSHVRRLWDPVGGLQPTDEELRSFLMGLRVIVVDGDDGGPERGAALASISRVLQDPATADAAWAVVVAEGQAAAMTREWRDRTRICTALARASIRVTPTSQFASDYSALQQRSDENRARMGRDATLPVGQGLHIPRRVTSRLLSDAGADHLLVIGDAGAGKSTAVVELADDRAARQQVIVLSASDVVGADRLPLSAGLATVLRAWIGPDALLVIDGIDALRGAQDRDVLSGLVEDLDGSRWQVVATVRTFDARRNPRLQRAFRGAPVSNRTGHPDAQLDQVRHLVVADLSDDELDAAVRPPMELAAILSEASPDLRGLLRNPFNLRLAAEMSGELSASQRGELLAIRSRVGLLQRYWTWRVTNTDSTAREDLLERLSREMTRRRVLTLAETAPFVVATDAASVEALLSQGVLSSDGMIRVGRRILSFAHNILYDYATAIYVLLSPADPLELLATLDADESLPLVVRPSLELLVDLLWEQRQDDVFWPLCLALADSNHPLAALAFASRLTRLVSDPEDLTPLSSPLGRQDLPGKLRSNQEVVRQLTGAFRAPSVLTDAKPSSSPMAQLALSLARNALASPTDAALALDLLMALERRVPIEQHPETLPQRAEAVSAVLDACRADPAQRERLAGGAARLAPLLMSHEAMRDAIERLLDDASAIQQWGGTVLTWLADAVLPAARVDQSLARRMASAVLTYQENRDEQVEFPGSGPLLGLVESRHQQAAHGVRRLIELFEEVCAQDLILAAQILCVVADARLHGSDIHSWPLRTASAFGWLEYGSDLSLVADGEGGQVAHFFAKGLTLVDPSAAAAAVDQVVAGLHNASAWAGVLDAHEQGERLAEVLLPAFESGALLAHPSTYPAAASLIQQLRGHEESARQIESAVVNAIRLGQTHGVSQRSLDSLLGLLEPSQVQSDEITQRLVDLDGEQLPAIPASVGRHRFTYWTPDDDPEEALIARSDDPDGAFAELRQQVAIVRNGRSDVPLEQRKLPQAFEAADAVVTDLDVVPEQMGQLLVEAAAALAGDSRVVPETPLGARVLAVLRDAAKSDEAGEFVS